MQPTELFAGLIAKITDFRPGLGVLDTSADLFGGDEIKRAQVASSSPCSAPSLSRLIAPHCCSPTRL